MIIGICVALAVTFGALLLHSMYYLGELKGYENALDDAEQIEREVREEFKNANNDE